MSAHQTYLSSILSCFSTFVVRRVGNTSVGSNDLAQRATELLTNYLNWKRDYNTWTVADLEQFLRAATPESLPAAQLLRQFVAEYPPFQANVFLHEYLLALQHDGCSESTIRNYRSDIQQFLAYSTEHKLENLITKPKLAEFARAQLGKGLKPSSVTRKVSSLAQFGLWAEGQGLLPRAVPWLQTISLEGLVGSSANQVATQVSRAFTGQAHTPGSFSIPPLADPVTSPSVKSAPSARANQELRARVKSRWSKLAEGIQEKTQQSLMPYLNLALIVLFFLGVGVFGYFQIFKDVPQQLAFPSSLTRPNRALSFQGRLTDTAKNPIVTASGMEFKLYDSGPSISGGTLLWDSGSCSVDPDQDGIFAVALGSDCGSEIASSVFSENANVWLQVSVESETLSPRQAIKTVAYALNSETLQGYPASASAVENTVVVMDNNGQVVFGNNSPVLKSTSGTFTIEGRSLFFTTTAGSNGNIVFDADGIGGLISRDYFSAPGATLSATYAGGVPLVLKGGPSGTANILNIQNVGGTTLSAFDKSGNLGIGNASPAQELDVTGNIQLSGQLRLGNLSSNPSTIGAGSLYYNTSDNRLYYYNGTNWTILTSGTVNASNYFTIANGTVYPSVTSLDLLVGGTSTASAKFGFINVDAGTPTATIAGTTANVATYLTGQGALGTTNRQNLVLGTGSTGDVLLAPAGSTAVIVKNGGNVGIGDTTPASLLTVGANDAFQVNSTGSIVNLGGAGHTITDSSGNLVLNSAGNLIIKDTTIQLADGSTSLDVFNAAADTNFSIANSDGTYVANVTVEGQVQLGTFAANPTALGGGSMYYNSADNNLYYFNGSAWSVLTSGSAGASNYWSINNGTIYPSIPTLDLLVGGTTTASAKFALINVGSGTPTASIAGSLADVATTLTGDGVLGTTNRQSLVLGSSTTGSVEIAPHGTTRAIFNSAGSLVFQQGSTIQTTSGDLTLNPGGGQVTLTNGATINIGGITGVSYNAISDGSTSTYALTDNDLYVQDILEVGNRLYVAGRLLDTNALWQNDLNVFHPASEFADIVDLALGGTSTASANAYLSAQGWGFLTGARTGQAQFQLNETGDQNILVASKSGVTKVVIDNSGKVGVGNTTPVGLLDVNGAVTGKALAIFNETGDQDLLTASASGTTRFRIGHNGEVVSTNASSNNTIFNLASSGDLVVQNNGATFATFTDGGVFTLDSLNLDGNTIGITSDTDLLSLANDALTVNGDLRLADTFTLQAGGKTGTAYNVIANSGGAATYASSDNDLYVQDILEVGGSLYLGDRLVDKNALWQNDANVFHPEYEYAGVADLALGGTSTASAHSYLSAQGWGFLNGARTGQALFQLNETGNQNILVASASGTTKFVLGRDGLLTLANQATIDNTVDGTLAFTEPTIKLVGSTSIDVDSPTLDLTTQAVAVSLISSTNALNIDNNTISVDASSHRVGIGTTGPDAKLDVLSTSGEQFRITYADGTTYTGFTVNSSGGLNIDSTGNDITTPDRLTVGSATAGVGQANVLGAQTGKALLILNETGNQDLLTASASGTTMFRIGHNGEVVSTNNTSNDTIFNLASTGDFLIQDNGGAFATFRDDGVFILDSLNFDGTTIGLTSQTNLLSLAANALTVNGDVRLADTFTLEAGGLTGVAYNSISDSGGGATYATTDNDLYVQDILEANTGYFNNLTIGGVAYGAASAWQNVANVYSPAGAYAGVADLAIGGNSTASANFSVSATTGYVTGQRFVDKANSSYYLDPAAAGTALAIAGSEVIGGTSPTTNYELDVNGDVRLTGQLTLGNLSANPSALGGGSMYYNSNDGFLYYYNGSSWTVLTSGSSGIGQQFWTVNNGALYPTFQTVDLLLGSTATNGAKFRFSADGLITQYATVSATANTVRTDSINITDNTSGTAALTGLYLNWTATPSAGSGNKYFEQFQRNIGSINYNLFTVDASGSTAITKRGDPEVGNGADGDLTLRAGEVGNNAIVFNGANIATLSGRSTADGVSFNISSVIATGSSTINIGATPTGLAVGDEILIINLRDQGNIDAPRYGYAVQSTATSGTGTTLVDSGQSWATNAYTGMTVVITSGTGVGQQRTISSNDGTSITVSSSWTSNPDATSVYKILDPNAWTNNLADIRVGQWETHRITAINTNTVTLDEPLRYGYNGVQFSIMVQRVPNYRNVTIPGNSTLTTTAFSTATKKGGVIFFRATGTVTVNGTVTVVGDGYQGASGGITYNGAGGAVGASGQGGGGSGSTGGTIGGGGGGTGGNVSAGGGYGTVGIQAAGNSGFGTIGGNGSAGRGGGGGSYGDAALTHLMLGSAGGHSGASEAGGIIFIATPLLNVNGSIAADGSSNLASVAAGAGGSLYLKAYRANIGNNKVTAAAGTSNNGDNGGSGRIRLDYNTLNGSTSPSPGFTSTWSDASNPVLTLDNYSNAASLISALQNGTEKFAIRNDGALVLNTNRVSDTGSAVTISDTGETYGSIFDLSSTTLSSGSAIFLNIDSAGTVDSDGSFLKLNNDNSSKALLDLLGKLTLHGEIRDRNLQINASGFDVTNYGQTTIVDTTDYDGTGADGDFTMSAGQTITFDAASIATISGRSTADGVNFNIPTFIASGSTKFDIGATPTGLVVGDEILMINMRDQSNLDKVLYGYAVESTVTSATDSTHLTDSTKTWTVNQYAGMTVVIASGTGAGQSRSIVVNDATTISVNSAWSVTPDNTSTYKIFDPNAWANNINAIHVGQYETRRITTISGQIITVNEPFNNEYNGSAFSVMVQRVPNYRNVIIPGNSTLTTTAFSTTTKKGGVIFFRASGVVTLNGTMSVIGKGYQGGDGGITYNGAGGTDAGANGQGGSGKSASSPGTIGGGGGGGGTGGQSGGGGYGTVGIQSGGNNGSGTRGGDGTSVTGGGGGIYGDEALTHLMLGSGGGHAALSHGSGIIFISTPILNVNGSLAADGSPSAANTAGGAGGSIYLKASIANLGSNKVTATGGISSFGDNGGAGRIRLDFDTVSGTTSPTAGYTSDLSPASLLINKNNGFGDLLTLQASSSDRFRVDYNGLITQTASSSGSTTPDIAYLLQVNGTNRYMFNTSGQSTQNAISSASSGTNTAQALNITDNTTSTAGLAGLYLNWAATPSAGSGNKYFEQFQRSFGTNYDLFTVGASGSTAIAARDASEVGTGADGALTLSAGQTITLDGSEIATLSGRSQADAVNFRVTANTASGSSTITTSTTPTGLAAGDEVLIINLRDYANADAPFYGYAVQATASSGTASTLVDSSQSWTTNQFAGMTIVTWSGTGSNQSRTISSNDGTSVTVSPNWTVNPASGTRYVILDSTAWATNISKIHVGQYETHHIQSISSSTLTLDSPTTNTYDGTKFHIMIQRVPNYTNVTIPGNSTLSVSAYANSTGKGGVLFLRASGVVTVGGTLSANAKGYTMFSSNGGGTTYNGWAPGSGQFLSGQGGGAGLGGTNGGTIGGGGGDGNCDSGGGGYGTIGLGVGGNGSGTIGGVGAACSSGGGGTYGSTDLSHLNLGSEGGNGNGGGGGGAGGGVIYVVTPTLLVNDSGSIAANGGNFVAATQGGGGSGGSIYLKAGFQKIGASKVTALNGAGKLTTSNGGFGRIRLDYTTLSGSTSLPAAGFTATWAPTTAPALSVSNYAGGSLLSLKEFNNERLVVNNDGSVSITTNRVADLGSSFKINDIAQTSGNIFDLSSTTLSSGSALFLNIDSANSIDSVGNFLKFNNDNQPRFLVDLAGNLTLHGETQDRTKQINALGFDVDQKGQTSIIDSNDYDGTGADGAMTLSAGQTITIDGAEIATLSGRSQADAVNFRSITYTASGSSSITTSATPTGLAVGDEILVTTLRDPFNTDGGLYGYAVNSTASSGTTSTLTDSTQSWTTNQFAGMTVVTIAGTGVGQSKIIASNTATTLTISAASTWTAPDSTTRYIIMDPTGWTNNLSRIRVGQYETRRITAISGTQLTVDAPFANTYDGNLFHVMVQRVPQYTNVTIPGNSTLSVSAYSNATGLGGMLFFRATGTVTVNGTLSAASKGYNMNTIGSSGGITYNGVGGGTDNLTTVRGGGAGVNGTNGGTIGGGGGNGNCTAGGGGYATIGGGVNANASASTTLGSTVASGCSGAGGGTYGDAALTHLMFGSSGGNAFGNTGGGIGGGAIFVAAQTISVTGSVTAVGGNQSAGVAGGGAGGSIYLKALNATLGTTKVVATGGTGNTNAGGTGRIRIDSSISSGTTSPAAGYTSSFSVASLSVNRQSSIGDILGLQYAGTDKLRVDNSGNIWAAANAQLKPLSDSTTALQIANNAGTAYANFDSTNSRVGIGTTTPAFKLDVADTQTSTVSAMITNLSTNANAAVLALKVGNTTPATTNNFITFLDGNGDIVGKINGNGAGAISYTSNGVDFAEYFKKADPTEEFAGGELVCSTTTGGVTKCQAGTASSSAQTILGVVSDSAGFVGGSSHQDDPSYVMVGLLGQLKVKTLAASTLSPNDALTASILSGYAGRADNAGTIIGRVQEVIDDTTVFATIQPGWFDPDTYRQSLADMGLIKTEDIITSASDSAEVATDSATPIKSVALNTNLLYQLRDSAGRIVNKIGSFSEAAVANLKAGVITAKDVSVEKLSVAGQSIQEFVDTRISQYLATNPIHLDGSSIASQSSSVTLSTISLPADTVSTQSGAVEYATLDITDHSGNTVAQINSQGNATLLGSLTADSVNVRTASVAGAFTAQSARLDQLEAKLADLQTINAQTANLVNATVSGTLNVNELNATQITGFEDRVASTLKAPSLLAKLMAPDDSASTSASVASMFQTIDGSGYVASSTGQLNRNLSDLNLAATDISLGASAVFVDQYFKTNGDAYIGGSLGVNQEIVLDGGMTIANGSIDGVNKLSFLSGVMTVEDSGLVSITGNLHVSGDLKVDGSLLTNLLQPTNYDEPLQLKLATRSGQVAGATTDSRFEVVGAENQPVATISAQGQGSFADGLKIGADDLTTNAAPGATLTSDKTSGKATIFTGADHVMIVDPRVSEGSLIYVTPMSATGNQVLYVKEQVAENPQTSDKEGRFSVGFETPLDKDVTFNWWIVN